METIFCVNHGIDPQTYNGTSRDLRTEIEEKFLAPTGEKPCPDSPFCLNPDDKNDDFENDNVRSARRALEEDALEHPPLSGRDSPGGAGISPELVSRALAEEDIKTGTEHPDYEGEDYVCLLCGKTLTEEDN